MRTCPGAVRPGGHPHREGGGTRHRHQRTKQRRLVSEAVFVGPITPQGEAGQQGSNKIWHPAWASHGCKGTIWQCMALPAAAHSAARGGTRLYIYKSSAKGIRAPLVAVPLWVPNRWVTGSPSEGRRTHVPLDILRIITCPHDTSFQAVCMRMPTCFHPITCQQAIPLRSHPCRTLLCPRGPHLSTMRPGQGPAVRVLWAVRRTAPPAGENHRGDKRTVRLL